MVVRSQIMGDKVGQLNVIESKNWVLGIILGHLE